MTKEFSILRERIVTNSHIWTKNAGYFYIKPLVVFDRVKLNPGWHEGEYIMKEFSSELFLNVLNTLY